MTQTTSADRCRNCGLLHKTYACPSFGPMFPAPGRSRESYEEENTRIQNLIAADVMREHYGHDGDDEIVVALNPRQLQEAETARRSHVCDTCGAQPGRPCLSRKGEPSKAHKSRYDAQSRAAADELVVLAQEMGLDYE